MSRAPDPSPVALAEPARRRPVNLRSVCIGLMGVLLICTFAPFNDWVLNNTLLINNFLPVSLLLVVLALVMLVNAPLRRWRPGAALDSGEIAVVIGMILVSCAIPSSGLMRYLLPGLLNSWSLAVGNSDYTQVMEQSRLPDWLLPAFRGDSVAERANDPLVTDFWSRVAGGDDSFMGRVGLVPWAAWVRPAVAWGAFIAAFWGAILCGSIILRRQWAENERLPFPLASIWLALIETPPPGRALNALFRSRPFWIAAGGAFALHLLNGLNQYDPRHFPKVPMDFDLKSLLAERPWLYAEDQVKAATVYLSIVGVTFFVQTKVSFSLWFFFLTYQAVRMLLGTFEQELVPGMQVDQQMGAIVPYVATILWVGRHHWASVGRQMIGRGRSNDPQGRYLPYAVAGWGLTICTAGMVAWLAAAGVSLAAATALAVSLLTFYMIVARAVAETGLMYMEIKWPFQRPFVYAANDLGPLSFRTDYPNYYWGVFFNQLFGHDVRESMPPYATHALVVADGAEVAGRRGGRQGMGFVAALLLALTVGYVASWASNLYVEYSYATSLDKTQTSPINPWGADGSIRYMLLGPGTEFLAPRNGPSETHSRIGHAMFGAGVMAGLNVMRLRYTWWPLHPLGFLLAYNWTIKIIWISVFAGWLAKVMVVFFGGADLFRAAKALFIGLIIGEAGAAAFWLLISVLFSALGITYHSIMVLPP
jgi:hypothetical protein